ncbi:MAG: thioredoxin domain-containing protein [Sulfolobaceae archaeon]|nr:thioredoxin domain-containing protein [Sulfolobaceae archaeon]
MSSELESIVNEVVKKLLDKAEKLIAKETGLPAVTDENFHEIIKSNPIVVIDFWAPWCTPCYIYEPVFEKVANEYKDRAFFGRLNTDENPKTADELGIVNIPSTVIIVNGKVEDIIVGAVEEEILKEHLQKYIR